MELENGEISVTVAVALSAAFDTVYHDSLLDLLEHTNGIKYSGINRISILEVSKLIWEIMNHSVHQQSSGGTIYYFLSAALLVDIISSNTSLSGFADNHTLLSKFKTMHSVISRMDSIGHNLNPYETELVYFGSKQNLRKCCHENMNRSSVSVRSNTAAKLPGVTLDQYMSMQKHTNNQYRTAM